MHTLTNTYHDTHYATPKDRDEIDAIIARFDASTATQKDKRWAHRVKRALCGIDKCRCGQNAIGERA